LAASYRVVLTRSAENDLRNIFNYIRKFAPQAANNWRKGVRQAIASLKRYPGRAALAPETYTFGETIRELIYGRGNRGTYRILFAIRDQMVYVLHVLHGSRLPLKRSEE